MPRPCSQFSPSAMELAYQQRRHKLYKRVALRVDNDFAAVADKAVCRPTFADASPVRLRRLPQVLAGGCPAVPMFPALPHSTPGKSPVVGPSSGLHFKFLFGLNRAFIRTLCSLYFGLLFSPVAALCERVKRYTGSTQISRILWLRSPLGHRIYDSFDSMIPN